MIVEVIFQISKWGHNESVDLREALGSNFLSLGLHQSIQIQGIIFLDGIHVNEGARNVGVDEPTYRFGWGASTVQREVGELQILLMLLIHRQRDPGDDFYFRVVKLPNIQF